MLEVLAAAPCVALVPLTPVQAMEVGVLARRSSTIDLGHAAAEAVSHDAQLATENAAAMSRLLPADWPVIEL
jgi:hypothetical protein